jgi:hypothetical protein
MKNGLTIYTFVINATKGLTKDFFNRQFANLVFVRY